MSTDTVIAHEPVAVNSLISTLRNYPQWIIWEPVQRADKIDKFPFGRVDHPEDWTTLDIVFPRRLEHQGLGFVLTTNDPFIVIDIDELTDQAREILDWCATRTYIERSPGGGYHIWGVGKFTGNRHPKGIGIFGAGRYVTITGDVICNNQLANIDDIIPPEMNGTYFPQEGLDRPARWTDEEVWHMCAARPGFAALCAIPRVESWQNEYGYSSHSEADQAWFNIVANISGNFDQCVRLFGKVGLGQRQKAARVDYLKRTFGKAMDQSWPQIEVTIPTPVLEAPVTEAPVDAVVEPEPAIDNVLHEPVPGMIGELAQFIYARAPRPVWEIALTGALGIMAGICTLGWSAPTGSGLNLYLLLVARTGTGKGAIELARNVLFHAIGMTRGSRKELHPSVNQFIGPGDLASATGLLRALVERPCCLSIFDEFGHTLKNIASETSGATYREINRLLLKLYQVSEAGGVFESKVYAQKQDTIKTINNPGFSWIGETTPELFYETVNEEFVTQGLFPRILIIDYLGPRMHYNENSTNIAPDAGLVAKLDYLTMLAQQQGQTGVRKTVAVASGVQETAMQFDHKIDDLINRSMGAVPHMWNRAFQSALKLASLRAIGINPQTPVITMDDWSWAQRFVEQCTNMLVLKFERGEVGGRNFEREQPEAVLRIMREVMAKPWGEVKQYFPSNLRNEAGVSDWKRKVIPYNLLQVRCYRLGCFIQDRKSGGLGKALTRALDELIKSGRIMPGTFNGSTAKGFQLRD